MRYMSLIDFPPSAVHRALHELSHYMASDRFDQDQAAFLLP